MSAGVEFFYDRISHYLIEGKGVRALEVVVRDTARESLARLKPTALASVVVGQALTSAALLSAHIKGNERLSFQLLGNGHLGTILADITADGDMRARVQYPAVEGSAGSIHEQVLAGLGNGQLYVIKSTPVKELYRGMAAFHHTDVFGAVEHYLEQSEQVASIVWGSVEMAGSELVQARAVLLQALGGGDRDAFEIFRDGIDRAGVQSLLDSGADVPELLSALMGGATVKEAEVRPLRFRCRCSEERVLAMLFSLGPDELQDMVDKDGQAEITCDFCMTRFTVGAPQLLQLISMARRELDKDRPN